MMSVSMFELRTMCEAIGLLGFCLYVVGYVLLTASVYDSQSSQYFVINLLAAGCVLVSLSYSFNLSSALIQMFWIGISLAGIISRFRRPISKPVPISGS